MTTPDSTFNAQQVLDALVSAGIDSQHAQVIASAIRQAHDAAYTAALKKTAALQDVVEKIRKQIAQGS